MALSSSNIDQEQASSSRSFFGKTMRIEGAITSDEDLTIEGTVTGELQVTKTLTIGNNGHINGKIEAAVVRISGGAEGHLNASERLEIASSGKYEGHIKADKIMVAEGAQLKGTINITVEESPKTKEFKSEKEKKEKSDLVKKVQPQTEDETKPGSDINSTKN